MPAEDSGYARSVDYPPANACFNSVSCYVFLPRATLEKMSTLELNVIPYSICFNCILALSCLSVLVFVSRLLLAHHKYLPDSELLFSSI